MTSWMTILFDFYNTSIQKHQFRISLKAQKLLKALKRNQIRVFLRKIIREELKYNDLKLAHL